MINHPPLTPCVAWRLVCLVATCCLRAQPIRSLPFPLLATRCYMHDTRSLVPVVTCRLRVRSLTVATCCLRAQPIRLPLKDPVIRIHLHLRPLVYEFGGYGFLAL
jgi:hypothetical protein